MKKLTLLFTLLTLFFTTKVTAQHLSFGTGYSSINHDGYDLVFNTNTFKTFNFSFTGDFGTDFYPQYHFYIEHYTLEKPNILIDEDSLSTTTGLINFGIDFGIEYVFLKEQSVQPFVAGALGIGTIYANQTTTVFTNERESDIGSFTVRCFLKGGLRYSISDNIGIALTQQFNLTYLNFDLAVKSELDNRRIFTQSFTSVNLLYYFD
jgi:hypothetical protein